MSMTKEQAEVVIQIVQRTVQYYRDQDLRCMDMARDAEQIRALERQLIDSCVSERFDARMTQAVLHNIPLGRKA